MPLDPQAKAILDATRVMPDFDTLDLVGMGVMLDRANDAVGEACKALRNALGT